MGRNGIVNLLHGEGWQLEDVAIEVDVFVLRFSGIVGAIGTCFPHKRGHDKGVTDCIR